jgi:hypothetical protein
MRQYVLFFLLLVFTGCGRPGIPPQLQKEIDSIALKWVPDERENICEVTLRKLPDNAIVIKGETTVPEAKEEIIGYLETAGKDITDSLKILPDTSVINKKWGLVTVSVCNIYDKPSFSGELVSQALMGTPVRILKIREGWMLIQTPDHYLGWTDNSGISDKDDDEMSLWKKSERVIDTGKSGDIISTSDKNEVISDITTGSILEKVSESNGYFIVKLPDGRTGKIDRRDAVDFNVWCASLSLRPEKLIKFAKSLTGYPYMWGGTSTKALDCSGFVKTIFFTGGIILARDASQQFLYGKPVDISSSLDSLKPCDLIFFGHLNIKGIKRITHVGMYIGDTEMIHSSGKVRINSLDSTHANFSNYYKRIMMGARRIIGEESQKGIESIAHHNWYVNK